MINLFLFLLRAGGPQSGERIAAVRTGGTEASTEQFGVSRTEAAQIGRTIAGAMEILARRCAQLCEQHTTIQKPTTGELQIVDAESSASRRAKKKTSSASYTAS